MYMLCALVLLWLNHGHHDVDHSNDHHDLKAALKIQCNVADFAIEFYKIPAARSHEENLVFSPCSISMLLSVLLLGTDSNTHTEILNGLSFNMTHIQEDEIHQGFHELLHLLTHSEKSYKLDIGQALFLKEDKIKEFYEAEIQTTKFQEPKEDLDPETVFVLTNNIFFRESFELLKTFAAKMYPIVPVLHLLRHRYALPCSASMLRMPLYRLGITLPSAHTCIPLGRREESGMDAERDANGCKLMQHGNKALKWNEKTFAEGTLISDMKGCLQDA
uniref:Serpin domain-containing protein n=1 Tax=Laticauda laticaudata TaxID=8630 RepID=A0A8C5SI33_LATLA